MFGTIALLSAFALTVSRASYAPTFLLNVGGQYFQDWDSSTAVSENVKNGKVILLSENAGAYPCIIGAEQGHPTEWCNGGLPQLANLSAHEASLKTVLDSSVPAHFEGYVIFDWECWRPSWLTTFMTYRLASIDLAGLRNPNVTDIVQLTEIAAAEYDTAVAAFLVKTLRVVHEHRPRAAAVGFYGFPRSFWTADGAWNDTLAPYWAEVTLLAPSVYVQRESSSSFDQEMMEAYVVEEVKNAVNIANRFANGPTKVIAPYTWYRYDFPDTCTTHCDFLNALDTVAEFTTMFDTFPCGNGSACVKDAVIWGSEALEANATAAKHWLSQHRNVFTRHINSSRRHPVVAPLSRADVSALRVRGSELLRRQELTFAELSLKKWDNLPAWKACHL